MIGTARLPADEEIIGDLAEALGRLLEVAELHPELHEPTQGWVCDFCPARREARRALSVAAGRLRARGTAVPGLQAPVAIHEAGELAEVWVRVHVDRGVAAARAWVEAALPELQWDGERSAVAGQPVGAGR